MDSIGEFSVLTGNFSAEYGKSSGGVINAITKSGTNQLHGTAYEFLRNSAMDAKNFFDPHDGETSPFRRNQFGGSAGAPIQHDKMFVSGDYEGLGNCSPLPCAKVPTALAEPVLAGVIINAKVGPSAPSPLHRAGTCTLTKYSNPTGIKPTSKLFPVRHLNKRLTTKNNPNIFSTTK